MDLGNFFGDLFSGRLFGQKKKEEKQPQQVTVQKPSTSFTPNNLNSPLQTAGVKMPSSLVQPQQTQSNQAPVVGGVKMSTAPDPKAVSQAQQVLKNGGSGAPFKPEVISAAQKANFNETKPVNTFTPRPLTDLNMPGQPHNPLLDTGLKAPVISTPKTPNKEPGFDLGKFIVDLPGKLVSGIQQGAGNVADVGVQMGSNVVQAGNLINPFISEEERTKNLIANSQAAENIRRSIHGMKDITGNNIVGTTPVEASAARIANGTATAEDFAAVAGQGLKTGLDATMFANPVNLGREALAGAGAKELVKDLAINSLGLGGATGVSSGLADYGQNGDLKSALMTSLASGTENAAMQFILGGAGIAGGRVLQKLKGVDEVPVEAPSNPIDNVDNAPIEKAPETDINTAKEPNVAPDEPTVTPTVDPNAAITPAFDGTLAKLPAITSINAEYRAPRVEAPKTVTMPEVIKNEAPVVESIKMPESAQMPKVPRKVVTADEATAAAQDAIDNANVKAPEQPAPAELSAVQPTKKAESQNIAENTTPVSQEAIVAAQTAEAVNKAPTEAIAQNIADKVDPRVEKSNKEIDSLLKSANKSVKSEGSSYAQIVRKLYNNNKPDGIVSDLTTSERALVKKIQPKTNAVLDKMNKLGLTDADMGLITDYLPTTKPGETPDIRSVKDLESLDFGFTKSRKGNLTDAQVEAGAEQALRNYLNTGALLEDLTPEFINKVKLARRDKEFLDLIEVDGKGGNTGLQLSDAEIQSARANNQKLIDAENARIKAQERVSKGDTSKEAISAVNKAEEDATQAYIDKQAADYLVLEKKTDAAIESIRKSNELTAETKKQRITQLESHLTDVRNQTYYIQSTVRTNLLLGVGRIADQVNKGIQGVADKITSPIANIGANRSFNKSIGRDLFGDGETVKSVWNEIKNTPALNKFNTNTRIAETILRGQNEGKGMLAKAFGAYRMKGTQLTEAGSRYKIAAKDTVSFFVSKAKAEGLTDIKDISAYVKDAMSSSEFKRVHNALFEARNSFTGLPNASRMASKDLRLNVRNAIYNKLGDVPGMTRTMRENIADGVTIPVVGFPRLLYRLGVRGLDTATAGVGDFLKAATIKPKNEADALKKALLVQQGFRSAQSAGTLGTLGLMLGASGMTTGAYPTDANERARWEKDKIQPYSVKIGDQYLDLGRYAGPLAFPVMIGAAIGRGRADDIPATVGGITQQFLNNYGAESMGDVMTTAGSLLKGDWEGASKDVNRWLAGMTDAFVPASSLLNTAGKAQDIAQGNAAPDTSGGYVDALRAKFPVIRDGLPGKKDNLGNPITQGNGFDLLPGVSGGQNTNRAKSDNRDDSVMAEIDRFSKSGIEVMPAKDVKNANSQADAKLLMSSKTYQNADDETKANYLKEALLGSKTKDISKDLGSNYRSALIQHALMSDADRKMWLEDNANAADYYTGRYQNMRANNTLTSDENNLENKSGARYQSLTAQVNLATKADKTLQNMYNDISVEEWRAMIDPESEDYNPDMAAKLKAYDDARTKAGVSGKSGSSSKPKYTEKKGKSGSGTGKNFAFASLPSSLIGSDNGKGTYADNAPTFKPIADLQAPTGAAIPKGRTISIKKGIQL